MIDRVAVASGLRGAGVLRALVLAAAAHARQQGHAFLLCAVAVGNEPARRAWERLAFAPYGVPSGDAQAYEHFVRDLRG